ncbi:hypothetical protein [Pedobacter sp. KLB.chiD]|uniref:hypothetical protein n=1 Tax=Pedobacter sp. KLB.chiD TaxID=3387402 RepID=UPI00399BA383
MSFNIIAETSKKLDYNKIRNHIYSEDLLFDLIPMPELGVKGGDAIGICIPLKNVSEQSWEQLKPILKILKSKYSCKIYDLYGGQKLGLFNLNIFKKNLLGT